MYAEKESQKKEENETRKEKTFFPKISKNEVFFLC